MRSWLLILFIFLCSFCFAQDKEISVEGKWILNSVYRNNELYYSKSDSTVLINFHFKDKLSEKRIISSTDSAKIYKQCRETDADFKSTFINFKKDGTYETADATSILPETNGTYTIWTDKKMTRIATGPDIVVFTLFDDVLSVADHSDVIIEMEFIRQ